MGRLELGVRLDRLAEAGERAAVVAHLEKHEALAVPPPRVEGVEPQGVVDHPHRVFEVAELGKRGARPAVGLCEVEVRVGRSLEGGRCLFELPRIEEREPLVLQRASLRARVVDVGHRRSRRARPFQTCDGRP